MLARHHRSQGSGSGMTGVPGRVFVREGAVQGVDGTLEVRQVFLGCGLQDRVRGVEVPVREVVAHAGDLPPRDRWLSGEQVIR